MPQVRQLKYLLATLRVQFQDFIQRRRILTVGYCLPHQVYFFTNKLQVKHSFFYLTPCIPLSYQGEGEWLDERGEVSLWLSL